MEWETGVSRCKLLYTEWIYNKVLLCSTEKYIQYPVINYNDEKSMHNLVSMLCSRNSPSSLSSLPHTQPGKQKSILYVKHGYIEQAYNSLSFIIHQLLYKKDSDFIGRAASRGWIRVQTVEMEINIPAVKRYSNTCPLFKKILYLDFF